MRLYELRRNPEVNTKQSAVDFLRQYKDDPTMYLHTTNVMKAGIYPRSSDSHDSPAGIYAYRLVDIWDEYIEKWNTGEYRRGLEFLPYHGGDHLFILQSDIDPDFPHDYSEKDLARDMANLQKMFHFSDERMARLRRTARTNLNFRNVPAGYLWGVTKAIAAGIDHEFDEYTPVNTIRWNTVLRRLGYVGFNDPGMGLIHGAESTQAVFLTSAAFRIVDHALKQRKQTAVTIGDKKYIGGRLPKHLHMAGIPNTLFYNYRPEHFASVRTWTVDGIGLYDLLTFERFLPWNAHGIIKHVVIGTSANKSHEYSTVMSFFAKHPTPPKNITIEDIYVGTRMPASLIKLIPVNYPVETITISQFAMHNGLDSLPEPIKQKIRVQKSFAR